MKEADIRTQEAQRIAAWLHKQAVAAIEKAESLPAGSVEHANALHQSITLLGASIGVASARYRVQ